LTKLSHQLLGVCGGLLVLSLTANPLCSILFYAGNAFPDVDVLWNDFSSYKTKWYSHRGITHSILIPLFLLLTSACFLLAGSSLYPYMLAFASGVLFHDLCDAMSPTGIPLKLSYYPRFKLWTLYRNRSFSEFVLAVLVAVSLLTSALLLSFRLRTFSKITSLLQQIVDYLR